MQNHVKLEEVESVQIVEKQEWNYTKESEEYNVSHWKNNFWGNNKETIEVKTREFYKLTPITAIENNQSLVLVGGGYSGSSFNKLYVENMKEMENLDIIDASYKHNGEVIFKYPYARFTLDRNGHRSQYFKYFKTNEEATKFVNDLLEKSEYNFIVL